MKKTSAKKHAATSKAPAAAKIRNLPVPKKKSTEVRGGAISEYSPTLYSEG